MIEVQNLYKQYGDKTAVNEISFSADEGEAIGIVGPNGAGKTTTLKTLAGLIEPTGGDVQINSMDVQNTELHYDIGFLPEGNPVYERMTGLSYLRFFADLYDVDRETANTRITDVLDRLDLDDRDKKLGSMSKGMTRKILIARSLVNDPDVVIYDEPASGLDPVTTENILQFVTELKEDGKTIVFSAHNLYHVEEVCDKVLILSDGEIVEEGNLDEIRRKHSDIEYRVATSVELPESDEEVNGVHYTFVTDIDEVAPLKQKAREQGGEVIEVQTIGGSLEDIFLGLTTSDS